MGKEPADLMSIRGLCQKHFGPLIETAMNRCIHCTRCVRFLSDVAGTNELGGIGRGENVEISTYIKGILVLNYPEIS